MERHFSRNALVVGVAIITVGFVSGHWISGSCFSVKRLDSIAVKPTIGAPSMVEMRKTGRVVKVKRSPSEITERILEIDAISDFGIRITTANRFLRELSVDDCKAVLAKFGEFMSSDLRHRIVARLMEEDPNSAMALDPNGFEGHITYLARKSPDAAIEWLERRRDEMDTDQRKRFLEGFMMEVALRDPMKAKNLEKLLAPDDSHVDFGVFVAARGVDYTLNWLRNFDPAELEKPYSTILYALANYEPVQLLAKLESPEWRNLFRENSTVIAAGMVVADHQLANDYLTSTGNADVLTAESIVECLSRYGDRKTSEAVKWVLSLPENKEYDHARESYFHNAYGPLGDHRSELAILLKSSCPQKADDLYSVLDLWRYEEPDEAQFWLEEHRSLMPKRISPPRREFYGIYGH